MKTCVAVNDCQAPPLDALASEGRGTRKPRLNAGGGTSRPVVEAVVLPRELMLPLVFGLPLLYRPAYVADTCDPWPCKGFEGKYSCKD